MRAGTDDSPAPTTTRTAPAPDRSLAAARYGANIAGAPEVVRVARDDAVWALIRQGPDTHLARLHGRSLRQSLSRPCFLPCSFSLVLHFWSRS